jgi:hypothetical protein
MRKPITILLGLALLAYAGVRLRNKTKPAWFQQLQGWQKLFGGLAVILTLLIVLNPEFLALGLLGDTAFFDMLVLVLGLQLHLYATRAVYGFRIVLSRSLRWLAVWLFYGSQPQAQSRRSAGRGIVWFHEDGQGFNRVGGRVSPPASHTTGHAGPVPRCTWNVRMIHV